MIDLTPLQNGSDIRGRALSVEDGVPPNLTWEEASKLAKGYLLWLCNKTGKKPDRLRIAIGRDPRLTGKSLFQGLVYGLGPYGPEVMDCGLASTPAMFMATCFPETDCDGAVMITASHLPYDRNGFKFFDRQGGLNKEDISAIIKTAMGGKKAWAPLGPPIFESNYTMDHGKKVFPSTATDLMSLYCAHLRRLIKKGVGPAGGSLPLSGLKILVDAGNGGGGFFATQVLAPLGADIAGSLFLEPDGTFPNHPPNPENKEAMASISMAVLTQGADFGLIFDTDVDRSAAVDGRGREISRNRIVALAASLIAQNEPGGIVVTDSITSHHLTEFLTRNLGLVHLRYQRGYKNVINKALALNDQGENCPLAIETSGHAAFRENYFLDDGAYLAAKIVIQAAKLAKEGSTLDQMLIQLTEPAEEREIRMALTCEDFGAYGDKILQDLALWAQEHREVRLVSPNYEGVRLDFLQEASEGPEAYGWCLLRKSLHDPLMPLNLESDLPSGCQRMASVLGAFLASYPCLDSSGL